MTRGAAILGNSLDTGSDGILDEGIDDSIMFNAVCDYVTPIDTSGAVDPNVFGNRTNC